MTATLSEIEVTRVLRSDYDGETLHGDGIEFNFRGAKYTYQYHDLDHGLWTANGWLIGKNNEGQPVVFKHDYHGEGNWTTDIRQATRDEADLQAIRAQLRSLIPPRSRSRDDATGYHKGDVAFAGCTL